MKYVLLKPELNAYELAQLNFYASYVGYIFRFDYRKGSALFEREDKNIGYIQKDQYNRIYLVWKFKENVEYIDKLINICVSMNKTDIISETLSKFKLAIGMNVLTNTKITKKMAQYIQRYE